MLIDNKCPVCSMKCDIQSIRSGLLYIRCPRCGDYQATFESRINFSSGRFDENQRRIASSKIREMGFGYTLTSNDEEFLFHSNDISILEKADKLLLALEKRAGIVGGLFIGTSDFELMAESWVFYWEEFRGLLLLLQEMEMVAFQQDIGDNVTKLKIKANGWRRLHELHENRPDSSQGFVAMWFHRKMTPLYSSSIAKAIEQAGYAPHRVDKREHNDRIDDEIIRQIRRSRFVVADLTGHRGGVYYEAGFAHGLGIPVFLTCAARHFKKIHFDIRQYNCLDWAEDRIDEFTNALTARIEAKLGHGPHR